MILKDLLKQLNRKECFSSHLNVDLIQQSLNLSFHHEIYLSIFEFINFFYQQSFHTNIPLIIGISAPQVSKNYYFLIFLFLTHYFVFIFLS